MAANANTVKSAIHNVTQAAAGTVDTVTFNRPGRTLWIYNRAAADITLVARGYTGNVNAAAEPLADPVALDVNTHVIPQGTKTIRFRRAIDQVKLVAGASMTYDLELI